MPLVKSTDLHHTYAWTTKPIGDNPRLAGKSELMPLDRGEGYDVLNFVNEVAGEFGFRDLAQGLQIETMIHAAPEDLRGREDLKKWIAENWQSVE